MAMGREQPETWGMATRTAEGPCLRASQSISLPHPSTGSQPSHQPVRISTSKAVAHDKAASVVAILKWPSQCHSLAKKLGGAFSSMDELESKDLLKHAEAIDLASSGCAVALEILRVARECVTGLQGR